MKIVVATCQVETRADIRFNQQQIEQAMVQAAQQGADVAHFPEACLSGYAGADMDDYQGYDWTALKVATEQLMVKAAELQLWLVLGSTHPLNEGHKPHNSLYIINDKGELVDRYDKRFCAGDVEGGIADLAHYSPGDHFCTFEIKGVRCGTLICHDYRYPELYREYHKLGVQVMFHSYHAAACDEQRFAFMQKQVGEAYFHLNPYTTIPGITQPAAMHCAASNNYMWISCPNSASKNSCWGSFMVRPDGVITGNVPLHEHGVLITEIDTAIEHYDSTVAWRERAMNGIYNSGQLVDDPRSDNRQAL